MKPRSLVSPVSLILSLHPHLRLVPVYPRICCQTFANFIHGPPPSESQHTAQALGSEVQPTSVTIPEALSATSVASFSPCPDQIIPRRCPICIPPPSDSLARAALNPRKLQVPISEHRQELNLSIRAEENIICTFLCGRNHRRGQNNIVEAQREWIQRRHPCACERDCTRSREKCGCR